MTITATSRRAPNYEIVNELIGQSALPLSPHYFLLHATLVKVS